MKIKTIVCIASLFASSAMASNEINPGKEDSEVGAATRAMMSEQTEGKNRAEAEPYRAESAGKAYRSYVDSIGQASTKLENPVTK